MTRKLAIAVSLSVLALVSACGSDDDPEAADTSETTAPADDSGDDETSEPEDSTPAEEPAESTTLIGMVGTEDDPDAFVITLTDESGAAVTSLPAGDYTIQINDPSTIHNFHLTGGSVDETTTVDEVTEVTWDVTLEPGDYTIVCDPHPNMVGGFTVT